MKRLLLAALAPALVLACSAYQRTYERETQRLETEASARRAQDEAAYAEARRYAAVVYFATGSSTLTSDGERELRWFVDKMQPYPQAVILAQGFADSTGAEATNQRLSEDRALAVKAYLASHGIADSRIVAQAFGTGSPALSNRTAKGRTDNRRAEVTVR
jgi:OOP family OmpA-OmpF porin